MNSQQTIQQQNINELVRLLQLSQKNSSTEQAQVFAKLKSVENHPQAYMCFLKILISNNYSQVVRQLSGLNLKNMIKRNYCTLSKQMINTIKKILINNYQNENAKIRKIIGLILGIIIEVDGIDYNILQILLHGLKNNNMISLECIHIIIEDLKTNYQNNHDTFNNNTFTSFLEKLIKLLLSITQTQNKGRAMQTLNLLIYLSPLYLLSYLKNYIVILYKQLLNNNNQICLYAIQGLQTIAQTHKDLINIQIIQRVVNLQTTDQKIKKNQANFWIQILDNEYYEVIQQYLPILIKKWIQGLIFTSDDLKNILQTSNYNAEKNHEEQQNLEEKDFMSGGDYTLRKRCGKLIKKAGSFFSSTLWNISMPLISPLFMMQDWKKCQMAILYIGLISQFCSNKIEQNFLQIIALISNSLSVHNEDILSSTSIWTISQYTKVLLKLNNHNILESYIVLILNGMKNPCPNVRLSACNSLSILLQQGNGKIVYAFQRIASTLRDCLLVYKRESLYSLYGLIAIFAESIPKNLLNKQLTQFLLIPLCKKWSVMSDSDTDLCALIQCLVTICEQFNNFISPYCIQLYKKSQSLLNPKYKQQLLRITDLISSLILTKNEQLYQLIKQTKLIQILLYFLNQNDHQIKQFSYSLINDIVKNIGLENPTKVLDLVAQSINTTNESLANNGLFCLIEIMTKYKEGNKYVYDIYRLALSLLNKKSLSKIYQVNFSKIIGRLALLNPEYIAPEIKSFIKLFCLSLKSKYEDENMNLAYKGLFLMIELNPMPAFDNFQYVVESFIFLEKPSAENLSMFRKLLVSYKNSFNQKHWKIFLSKFLPEVAVKLISYL